MDIDWSIKAGILLVLILGSAFFSGSEVALFSLDKKKFEKNFKSNRIISRYILSLINFPRRLLVTILIGNTSANVAASIVAVFLAFDAAIYFSIAPEIALTVQIVILTVLVLVFGELFPKIAATKNPYLFSKIIAVPMYYFNILIYPAAELISEFIKLLISKIKIDNSKSAISREEIPHLTTISHQKGALEEEEHNLISGLVSFASVTVEEIMTPRVDIIAVPADVSYDDLMNIITHSGHSRIPLFKDDLDEVVGIIYAKDLLPFSRNPELRTHLSLKKISRKALFVPETKLISELLKEFQDKKMHLAIVVDEYGGTAGLVTLEDIIEEVVGEIWDEYDKEEDQLGLVETNKWLALGKIPIDELNMIIGTSIKNEDEDFDTLGGFVLNHAGIIPSENYQFIHDGYKYIVKEIHKKRVKKILIEKLV
ncbi:MAG: HlyC/CorC family transporter [Ignavibacterium sp.]|nr:HlyC/CorC family transporter [Ignavibacterium sp.]